MGKGKDIPLTYVNCNLCGSDDTELLYVKDSLNVVRCKQCGLVYVNPRLPKAHALYEEDFFTASDYFGEYAIRIDKIRFQTNLKKIEKFKKGGRLLDIGCGLGRFIEMAQRRGWLTKGIDVSIFASRYARNRGLDVSTKELKDILLEEESFDVITLFHVLEHFANPLGFLKDIKPLLKTDGILVIELPNFGGSASTRLGRDWPWVKPRVHNYDFTTITLEKMLDKAGFEVLEMVTKGVLTFDGLQDMQQVKIYAELGNSKFGEILKKFFKRTFNWRSFMIGREFLVKMLRLLRYRVMQDDSEIFCICRKRKG